MAERLWLAATTAATEKRLQPIGRAHRRAKPLRGGVGNLNAENHGLNKLREALRRLDGRSLDPSTSIGKTLMTWRKELVADMGGSENVSTMQLQLIDVIVKQKLILDSGDAYLLPRPLVDKTTHELVALVLQRQVLADALTRYLKQLGLERRSKIKTLSDVS